MTTRRTFLGRLLGGIAAAPLARLLPTPPMPAETFSRVTACGSYEAATIPLTPGWSAGDDFCWIYHNSPPIFWDRCLTDAEVAAIAAAETA